VAYRSVYCYAWDLADKGVEVVAKELRTRHINTITLAGSYHAGKFLRPHGENGKVYFPADGTVYFPARLESYGDIRPVLNEPLAREDLFRQCCEDSGMAVTAWMVLLHNSVLGERHSECCTMNAFGDRYIYSLCPASPAARRYAVALCGDIATRYELASLAIESPGYAPFEHGYHHEFSLVAQNVWLNNLLGLCFCENCISGGTAAGIDMSALRLRVAGAVERWLSSGIDYPPDMAAAFWAADIATEGDLASLIRWRCETVTSLVGEIRSAVPEKVKLAVIPSVARPTGGAWYEGSDLAALARTGDLLELCFYEPGPDRIAADLLDVTRRLGGTDRIRAILRPGHPDLTSGGDVAAAVNLLIEGGVQDISFYNYGHLRQSSLDWIGAALAGAPS
jgi:hypothetical protein